MCRVLGVGPFRAERGTFFTSQTATCFFAIQKGSIAKIWHPPIIDLHHIIEPDAVLAPIIELGGHARSRFLEAFACDDFTQ